MNIFALDTDWALAAQSQCDKHVVKMILESAQMLCTAKRMLDLKELKPTEEEKLYRATHTNHPCSKWARETSGNYRWLYRHFCSLCDEYTHRYERVHATDELLRDLLLQPPRNIERNGKTVRPLAMPKVFHSSDPILSYRHYYRYKQAWVDMHWTGRDRPDWLQPKPSNLEYARYDGLHKYSISELTNMYNEN